MIVDQTSNRPLPRGVRRAVDAMREDFGQKRSVTELAAVAGVSSRTLQRQFLTFVRKTPRAVARDIGFDNARRELLQGAPSAKVMDIAARSGFPHCGRFSVEYRRRYGETPSQTLKRQAFFLAALGSPRSSFVPSGGWPTIALCKIEATPEHFEIAANISEDLTSALTRAGISVVREARSARYQLIGAIRGTGTQTRLVFRMIDRGSGRQLWAHRTDGALVDAAEKQLATRIAAALQPCLRLAEVDHALRKPDPDLSADDLALRAMPGVLSLDDEGNARALELLDCAMEYDPKHALATALAAWAHIQRVTYCFSSDPQHDLARSRALAEKARTLSGNAMVLAVLGNALTLLSELDAADLVIRKASRLMADRLGHGAAAAGSTPIEVTPNPPSNVSRYRSILRRRIRSRSTIWSASAAPTLRRANLPRPPDGSSVLSSNFRQHGGYSEPCVPPICSPQPHQRHTER
jgi:AraC-like DNA-binding protein